MYVILLDFIKAIIAGIVIALSGLVYAIFANLGIEYKIAGAFLFAFGLLSVLDQSLNLITGKFQKILCGEWKPIQTITVLFGNIIGAIIIYLIRRYDALPELIFEDMQPIIASYDNKTILQIVLAGIICGICIHTAVLNFNRNQNPWGVILPIMVFILGGGAHCIAMAFYFTWCPLHDIWHHTIQILAAFIGNAIGAGIIMLPTVISRK